MSPRELTVGPGQAKSGGRTVSDVLDAWVDQNMATWAPSSAYDNQSRVASVKKDMIAALSVARLSVGDVERWHTRMRGAGMADAGLRNLHGVLRAALAQALRWGWVSTNVAAMAKLRSTKVKQRTVLSVDDVLKAIDAAANDRPGSRRSRFVSPPSPAHGGPSWPRCDGPTSTATSC